MNADVYFLGVQCQSIYSSKINRAVVFHECYDDKIQLSIENKFGEMLNFQGKAFRLKEWCEKNDLEYFETTRCFSFIELFK